MPGFSDIFARGQQPTRQDDYTSEEEPQLSDYSDDTQYYTDSMEDTQALDEYDEERRKEP